MNIGYKKILGSTCFLLLCLPLQAQQTTPPVGSFGVDKTQKIEPFANQQILEDIKKELLYLGYYLGFPIDANSETPPTISSQAAQLPSNIDNVRNLESLSVKNLLGIISSSILAPSFVPDTDNSGTYRGFMNGLANTVLKNHKLFSSNIDVPLISGGVPLKDASNPISPVSQLVMNILSNTPDALCVDENNHWNKDCTFNYTPALIYAQALGLGNGSDLFPLSTKGVNAFSQKDFMIKMLSNNNNVNPYFPTTTQNPQALYLQQVDSSGFLSPLVYTAPPADDPNTPIQMPFLTGIDANSSQVTAAQAFFRNVTGTILPSNPPDLKSLQAIQSKIQSQDLNVQLNAFKSFSKYILGERVYAAQASVAIQNIYEIMSKRMPLPNNNSSTSGSPTNPSQTSQALNEFVMATYRLSNPESDKSSASSWQNMISTTSSANVQREIAILLSELNYQMYLMRQQQERLILTNSITLLNYIRAPELDSGDSNDSNS